MGAGLLLYDLWAGRHLPRARHLSRRAALEAAPALRPDSLIGAVSFHDAQEDDALYAVYVARTAAVHGASVATRVEAASFLRDETGRILGVRADDRLAGRSFEIRARHTIAAVGVATDRVLELATGRPQNAVRPSKGVHLIVPRSSIPMRSGLFMRTEKSIFHAIPWGADHWLLGDTDTEWDGEVDTPVANRADVDYVLAKVNSVLTKPVRREEICGVFAGLRPLVAAEGGDGHHPALARAPAVLASPRADGHRRRQVHDLPRHGARRRRHGRRRSRVDCSFDDRPGSTGGSRRGSARGGSAAPAARRLRRRGARPRRGRP